MALRRIPVQHERAKLRSFHLAVISATDLGGGKDSSKMHTDGRINIELTVSSLGRSSGIVRMITRRLLIDPEQQPLVFRALLGRRNDGRREAEVDCILHQLAD